MHLGQIVAAAKAGKHVFCEKPLALSKADAETAIEACQKAGVSLALDPGNAEAKWAGLLTSRRFWATAVGLLGLLGSQVWHVELDQGGLVGYVLVISSLVVGLGIHAGDSSAKWAALLVDKRFWTAAVGLVVVFLNAFHTTLPYGLTQEQILGICVALGGYITAGSVGAQGAAAGPVVVQDVGTLGSTSTGDGEPWPFLGSK